MKMCGWVGRRFVWPRGFVHRPFEWKTSSLPAAVRSPKRQFCRNGGHVWSSVKCVHLLSAGDLWDMTLHFVVLHHLFSQLVTQTVTFRLITQIIAHAVFFFFCNFICFWMSLKLGMWLKRVSRPLRHFFLLYWILRAYLLVRQGHLLELSNRESSRCAVNSHKFTTTNARCSNIHTR